jgi:hypothetical protein
LIEEFGALAPLANLLSGMVSVPDVFKEEMRGLADASNGHLPYDLVLRYEACNCHHILEIKD